MRIGVLASTNGGVFRALAQILAAANVECEFAVMTDRPCGIEEYCRDEGIACRRGPGADNAAFSRAARTFLHEQGGVEFALLFLTRLVTADLYGAVPTFNLHPSLLPDFRGFGALEQALDAGVGRFGATLHLVDAHVDAGPIVGQVGCPLEAGMGIEAMRRHSFLQKVYLSLVLVELFRDGDVVMGAGNVGLELRRSPALQDPGLREGFDALESLSTSLSLSSSLPDRPKTKTKTTT